MGEAEREAEAAADPAREGGHREVALAPLDRRRPAAPGRAAEAPRSPSQSRTSAGAGSTLSAASAAAVTLAPLPCGLPRLTTWAPAASASSAVPSPEASSATQIAAAGKAPRSAATVSADPVGLVAGGDYHCERVLHGGYCPRPCQTSRLTSPATCGKSRSRSATQVADGDTVAILESMKMEIPVESEEDGTVKEIRCEEGQAVSEGDVLVVLE